MLKTFPTSDCIKLTEYISDLRTLLITDFQFYIDFNSDFYLLQKEDDGYI
jgi:hypothetical protein